MAGIVRSRGTSLGAGLITLLLLALFGLWLAGLGTAYGATFVVDSTGDESDAAVGDGVCGTAGGTCTLRAAIEEANSATDRDTIAFNIAGTAPHIIAPLTALPSIDTSMVIDARTQPGFNTSGGGPRQIVLTGSGLMAGAGGVDGFLITATSVAGATLPLAGRVEIWGFAIRNWPGAGIHIASSGNNTVEQNYIGLNWLGAAAEPNRTGVDVEGPANRIAINVISGNQEHGIRVIGAVAGAQQIVGNLIGEDPAQQVRIPNGLDGIFLAAPGSTVIDNSIVGNGRNGIQIFGGSSSGNVVESNSIHDQVGHGILIASASGNLIDSNTLFANGGDGIAVTSADGVLAQGNTLTENIIRINTGLGIDLEDDGVTVNDFLDPDSGSNQRQNFPTFWGPPPYTEGELRSAPNTAYDIEIYQSGADPTGHGEGPVYVATVMVMTNAQGIASFDVPLAAQAFPTGTATDPDGNTSEFGPRIQHDSDGSGLPPVSSSGLLVQPRDAIDWTLFNDPIDGGTFEVDGQTAFPGVDIGVDGWIAFGDPSQRTPPGVDEATGAVHLLSPCGSACDELHGLDLPDAADLTLFGDEHGLIGSRPLIMDLNADGSLDLVVVRPPTSFLGVGGQLDPYTGQGINVATWMRDTFIFYAPGIGVPLGDEPGELMFPDDIGDDFMETTIQTELVQLNLAGLAPLGDPLPLDSFFDVFVELQIGGQDQNLGIVTGEQGVSVLTTDPPLFNPEERLRFDFPAIDPVDLGPAEIFADGFESGDTTAWSMSTPAQRANSLGELRVAQADAAFCASLCLAVPEAKTGSSSVFLIDLAAIPRLGNLSVTGDEPWARRITDIPAGSAGISTAFGDLNGDGALDLVLGVPGGRVDDFDQGQAPLTGVVYVVLGPFENASLIDVIAGIFSGEDSNEGFGGDVAVGDVTLDGIPDIAITSHRSRPGGNGPASGALTIVVGAPPIIDAVSDDGVITTISGSNLYGIVLIDGVRVGIDGASANQVRALGAGETVAVQGIFGVAQRGGGELLEFGWNLTGWRGATATEVATQSIAGQFDMLLTWDAGAGRFLSFNPLLPGPLNSLKDLERGDGVWILINDPAGAAWIMPEIDQPRDVTLRSGQNLVIWTGADGVSIEEATASLGNALLGINLWDASAQRFLSFNPLLPGPLNQAKTLTYGAGVWIRVSGDMTWSQPARSG